MARRLVRCTSAGNLLDADDTEPASLQAGEQDMQNSFLPGLLGRRKLQLPEIPTKSQECKARIGRVTVKLKKGLVYDEEVDAIVNSTSQTLTLGAGNASRAMLQKAGSSIQDECNRKYPKGIQFGEIAETGGGNLYCGYIFHGCLKYWTTEENLNRFCDVVS